MSFAPRVRPGYRGLIPAVVARDGTARVHTVTAADNPLYRRVIERFAELTGVPMVLNTSLNRGEPTVCTPADAVRTFVAAGLDVLVIGRYVAEANVAGRTRTTRATASRIHDRPATVAPST
jgi:carbamoyltransferase